MKHSKLISLFKSANKNKQVSTYLFIGLFIFRKTIGTLNQNANIASMQVLKYKYANNTI